MIDTFKITICPTCGSEKIKKLKKKWSSEFKGQKYSIPLLEYYECPDCNEKVYDRNAMQQIQEKSPAMKTRKKRKAA